MTRSEELAARLAANRFRLGRLAFAEDLRRLLGCNAPEPVADAFQAADLAAEFLRHFHTAARTEWTCVRREWGVGEEPEVVAALHALGGALGTRPVWLLLFDREPQAVALGSEFVLDNPLGFAGATDYQLWLLDREASAGCYLTRHGHHFADTVEFTWELEAFGEPWLTAARQAVREAD